MTHGRAFHFCNIFLNIINNIILDAPLYKIELCDCRSDIIELYTLRAAKWVKQLFTVTIKATLICHVYCECFSILPSVTYLLLLTMVCNEPLYGTQRHLVGFLGDGFQCGKVVAIVIKLREALQ